MEKLAIIGSGIAGMTCAWYLKDLYEIDLYEKEPRPGGHTHTVEVDEGDRSIPVDTGFMVYNDHTYPNLLRLFAELEVPAYPTDMSFGVNLATLGCTYASSGFGGFFAQKKNLCSPSHWRLAMGIKKFFAEANRYLAHPTENDATILEFFSQRHLDPIVAERFFLPMASAIWSTHHEGIADYPARSILSFMANHGLLGIGTQFKWKTVQGGSKVYRDRLLAGLPQGVKTGRAIVNLLRSEHGAVITDQTGQREAYDLVIVATHADQALTLLANPTQTEVKLLSAFRYTHNRAILHSDESVMPKERRAWSSWNYRLDALHDGSTSASTHYWMNRLQPLNSAKNYFVSIDHDGPINNHLVHWSAVYQHPSFDLEAVDAQKRLPTLNATGPVFYCGSYFKHGFHEDAHVSALQVVKQLKQRKGKDHEILPV